MPFRSEPIVLTEADRIELTRMSHSRVIAAGDVFRARLVLMLAAGDSYREIQKALRTTPPTISHWKKRFLKDGVVGLAGEKHPGRKPTVITPRFQAKVLAATQRKPTDGSTHWSCRKLAKQLGVSKDTVHRIWQKAGLKPHRLERYMASNDPDFEQKAADIIGLYLNPPQHAALFCVDEKSAIQALDRLDPVLPMSPGRAERHGFEYYRHGTLSLYAALDVKSGKVHGKTASRHTSEEFVGFLEDILRQCGTKQKIHIILDNLSAHKTRKVTQFLQDHPNMILHFTPTYSSWLNQIEIWFSRIERDVIARGIFTSVKDLSRKLLRYIRSYSQNAQPFRWTYSDPTRRIYA